MLVWFVSKTATESQVRCEIPRWDHCNHPSGTVGLQKNVLKRLCSVAGAVEATTESMLRDVQLEENEMMQQAVCLGNMAWLHVIF